MSGAFSITAPRMTLRQMREEWDSFSTDQQQIALCDLNGEPSRPNPGRDQKEMLILALYKLENELSAISHKPAFSKALEVCPDIVKNDRFRLQFLWAEDFDEKLAAIRLIRYWEEKVTLFGEEKAFGEITQEFLGEEDRTILDQGGILVLPEKDNAQRAVILSCRLKWAKDRNSMLRALWCLVQQTLQDEHVQKNGVVLLLDDRVPDSSFTPSIFDSKKDKIFLRVLRDVLPIRVVGIHHFFPNVDTYQDIIFPQFLSIIGPSWRARYRHYCGDSPATILSKLENFGISQGRLSRYIAGAKKEAATSARKVKATVADEERSQCSGSESHASVEPHAEQESDIKKQSRNLPERARQLERNRIAARARRKRQREQIDSLQVSIADLTTQNKKLHINNESLRAQATQLQMALMSQIDNPLMGSRARSVAQPLFPTLTQAQEAVQRQNRLHLLNFQQASRQLQATAAAIRGEVPQGSQIPDYLLEDPTSARGGSFKDPNKS